MTVDRCEKCPIGGKTSIVVAQEIGEDEDTPGHEAFNVRHAPADEDDRRKLSTIRRFLLVLRLMR